MPPMAEQRTLKRIGVVVHQDRPLAAELAARVIAWSEALGATVMLTDADARAAGAPSLAVESEQLVTADVVVAIGGDGTVLRAVGMVADAGVPLVALNAGQLGYLADVAPERAEWALDELAAGRGRLEAHRGGAWPGVGFHAVLPRRTRGTEGRQKMTA